MSSKSRKEIQHRINVRRAKKLQSAGFLRGVDLSKSFSDRTLRTIERNRDIATGRAAAVKAPDKATAARLAKQFNLRRRGNTLIIPKEKRERFLKIKPGGEIKSVRPGYIKGEKITKTFGEKFKAPIAGGNTYYTLPERRRGVGKLKRKTFASFDEMLYYLSRYDINFEDIEDYIEVEQVSKGGAKDRKLHKRYSQDRAAAYKRLKRRKRTYPKSRKNRPRR